MALHVTSKTLPEESKEATERQIRVRQLKKDDSCHICALNYDHAKPHCRMSQGVYYFEQVAQRILCKIQSEEGRVTVLATLATKDQERRGAVRSLDPITG